MSDTINALQMLNQPHGGGQLLAPAIINPLAITSGAMQTAGQVYDLRAKQADLAAGQAYQGAIDPATGQFDPQKFRSLLAANPAAAMAAGTSLANVQNISGAQLNQEIVKRNVVNNIFGTALTYTDPQQQQDYLTRQGGLLIRNGVITPEEGMNFFSAMPTDPAQRQQYLRGVYTQTLSPENQTGMMPGGAVRTFDAGGVTYQQGYDPVSGKPVGPQTTVTHTLTPQELAASHYVIDNRPTIPDPNDPSKQIPNPKQGQQILANDAQTEIAAGADIRLFAPTGPQQTFPTTGRYNTVPPALRAPNAQQPPATTAQPPASAPPPASSAAAPPASTVPTTTTPPATAPALPAGVPSGSVPAAGGVFITPDGKVIQPPAATAPTTTAPPAPVVPPTATAAPTAAAALATAKSTGQPTPWTGSGGMMAYPDGSTRTPGGGFQPPVNAPASTAAVPPAPTAAPAPTTPAQIAQTQPSPGERANLEQSYGQFQKLQTEADDSRMRAGTLGNMAIDMQGFTPGPLQAERFKAFMTQWAPNLAERFGVTESASAGENFEKATAQIINQQNARSDKSMGLVEAATPSAYRSKEGMDLIIRQLQGNEDYLQARAKLGAAYANQNDYRTFQQQTLPQLDPRVFQLARMRPDQSNAYLDKLEKSDPRTYQQLNKAARFARDNGLLTAAPSPQAAAPPAAAAAPAVPAPNPLTPPPQPSY